MVTMKFYRPDYLHFSSYFLVFSPAFASGDGLEIKSLHLSLYSLSSCLVAITHSSLIHPHVSPAIKIQSKRMAFLD